MNKTQSTPITDIGTTQAERLLAAAGIDFTEVKRCPVADCPLCTHPTLTAAA